MQPLRCLSILASAACLLVATPARTQVWDSSVWVTPTGGAQPVNGWYFLDFDENDSHDLADATFMEWRTDSPPNAPQGNRWQSTRDTWCYINDTVQSTANLQAVRAWVAPSSGTVVITTNPNNNVRKAWLSPESDGTRIRIWRNNLMVFDRELGPTDTTGFALNETIAVNQYDVLWFHNHPNITLYWDDVIYEPVITLTAGPGYSSAAFVRTSSADFTTAANPNANHWSYESFDVSTGTYALMTTTGADIFGNHWRHATDYCRVWADRVHPSWGKDAVLVYTAPQDGWIMIRSRADVALINSNPVPGNVRAFVQHIPSAPSSTPVTIWSRDLVAGESHPLGIVRHLRTGDRIAFHARPLVTFPWNWYVRVDVDLSLFPLGDLPRPPVSMTGNYTPGPADFWFYESRSIAGNVVLPPTSTLTAQDCVISLANTADKEFNYQFKGGRLNTYGTVIGGNRLASGTVYHSNFEGWHGGGTGPQTSGRWDSKDTTVRYTYGELLGDGNNGVLLTGDRHNAGLHPDFVNMGGTASATLKNSTQAVTLRIPANVPGTVTLALPRNTLISPPASWNGANVPGVGWDLTLDGSIVTNWDVNMQNVPSGPAGAKIVNLTCPKIGISIAGTDLSGSVQPPIAIMNPGSSFDTFGVRFVAQGAPVEVQNCSFYLQGASTSVRINGPTSAAEMMIWAGAMTFSGNPGTYDAVSICCVLLAENPGTIMQLKDCTLGTAWTLGEIRARNGARILIDVARVIAPVKLVADGAGSMIITTNTNTNNFIEVEINGGQVIYN
jgi:hypothetical protein